MHHGAQAHQLKQFKQVGIAHIDAAMRCGHAYFPIVGCAVNIDIPSHGIARSQPVIAWLAAGQPQNTSQHPVTPRLLKLKLWRIYFSAWPAPNKDRIHWLPLTYFCTNNMSAARGAIAAGLLPCPVQSGRNQITLQDFASVIKQLKRLFPDIDKYFHMRC